MSIDIVLNSGSWAAEIIDLKMNSTRTGAHIE